MIPKYTPEYTQLNIFFKMFSEEHNLESPSNKTEQHYIYAPHDNTSGMYYKTTLLSQKYTPIFEHEF